MVGADRIFVQQMIDHGRKALARIADKQHADFDADEDLRIVVLHLVQILGEAARKVSPDFRNLHPQIPWNDIIGMRHKIVHDYMDINERILWEVVRYELGPLLERLERLVSHAPR